MVAFFQGINSFYFVGIVPSCVGLLLSVRNLFALAVVRMSDKALDFYIYYYPILFNLFYLCSLFILNYHCVPGLSMSVDSLVGACHLQLSINWLEVADNGYQVVTNVDHKTVLLVFAGVSFFELTLTGLFADSDSCDPASAVIITPSSISLLLLKTNIFYVIASLLYLVIVLKSLKRRGQLIAKCKEVYRNADADADTVYIPREVQFMERYMKNMLTESCSGILFCLARLAKPVVEFKFNATHTYMDQVLVCVVVVILITYIKVFKPTQKDSKARRP